MSSFVETSRSQLNSSRSKQLYTFTRANRFTSSNYVSPAPYYDNKVTALGKRATSFGYGQKLTLESKAAVPSPDHYKKAGVFEDGVKARKGYSFSHDPKKGLINQIDIGKIPGPGKYSYKPDRNEFKRVSYSFRGKYEDPLERQKNPLGPGQYSTIGDFNNEGKYFVTKYHNSGASKIGNSKRFLNYQPISPGPGKCIKFITIDQDTKVTGFNNSGTYFFSTFKTSKANAFSHGARKHIAEPTISPGPGAYNRFSDFPRQVS